MELKDILYKMNLCDVDVTPFHNEEDNSAYQVWKVEHKNQNYVLKKTTYQEVEVYQNFLCGISSVPKMLDVLSVHDDVYLLMSYEAGVNLNQCSHEYLKLALDSLIEIQERYWNASCNETGLGFDMCLQHRYKRLDSMGDLKDIYQLYLDEFKRIPKTLTHDDLLPFNVLCDGKKAILIDWNEAGILPYASSLARLIAYGQEDNQALFQMSDKEKQFALDYYYERFIKHKGIERDEYDYTMNLFLFKEYSEWIYCAYLSNDYEMEYYKIYEPKARELGESLRKGFMAVGDES